MAQTQFEMKLIGRSYSRGEQRGCTEKKKTSTGDQETDKLATTIMKNATTCSPCDAARPLQSIVQHSRRCEAYGTLGFVLYQLVAPVLGAGGKSGNVMFCKAFAAQTGENEVQKIF